MHLAHCRRGKGPILARSGRLRRHDKRREPNNVRFRTVDASAMLKLSKMSMFAPHRSPIAQKARCTVDLDAHQCCYTNHGPIVTEMH